MEQELPLAISEEAKNQVVSKIQSLIESKRSAGKGLYYLSSLGEDLKDDLKVIEPYFGLKLKGLVEDIIKERIVALGKNKNVFAIALKDEYEEDSPKNPLYKRPFWAAFFSSTNPTTPRYINLKTLFHSENRESVRGEDSIVKEIQPEFFTDHSHSDPIGDTIQKISKWLEEKDLDQSEFIKSTSASNRPQNLLENILYALDTHQLKNTTLSLDVVKRLLDAS